MTTAQTEQRTEEYNGWPNRETWAFMLWLQNDEGLYDSTTVMLADMKRNGQAITDTWCREYGDELIGYLFDAVRNGRDAKGYQDDSGLQAQNAIEDIGSTWRIDWLRPSTERTSLAPAERSSSVSTRTPVAVSSTRARMLSFGADRNSPSWANPV